MTMLTESSPLEQARHEERLAGAPSELQLSEADEAKLKELLEEDYDYIHDERFEAADAEKTIFDEAPEIPTADTSWYHPVMDDLSNGEKKNDGSVVFTKKEEQAVFLQYNYARYRVSQLRDQLLTSDEIDPEVADEMLRWYRRSQNLKEQIAGCNLALVLAMGKRTRQKEVDFAELVSEGNMALLRAVDKFDAARGFKFSTYACRAIIKAFSRLGVKTSRRRLLFPTDYDPKMDRSDHQETTRRDHRDDCVDEVKQMLQDNRARLSDIEQRVIEHRFAVGQCAPPEHEEPDSLTLAEVGKIIGVTKERVRQIQNNALEKLRETLDETYLS